MFIFPTADQAYTLEFSYYLLAEALDGSRPYAYGGMAHAETIRAACLMAAEETLDDAQGLWAAKFRERLAASIMLDRRLKPQHGGYNGDHSEDYWTRRGSQHYEPYGVTFSGVEY